MILYPLLVEVCRRLVDSSDKVAITYEHKDEGDFYVISTNSGEEGQIIGKNGNTINAIRQIGRAIYMAGKQGKVYIDVDTSKGVCEVATLH